MMKSNRKLLSGLLVTVAVAAPVLPSAWADSTGTGVKASAEAMQDFKKADKNRDGYLSSSEGLDYIGTSLRLDDLAFKAADINSDGRLSPEEFASHVEASRAKAMPATPVDKPAPYSY